MDENSTEESAGRRPGRRAVIKGAAAGAVGVWTLPVVTSFTSPAAAAGSEGNPHPECAGSNCGNFANCSSADPDCLCFSTSSGGGLCFRGQTLCSTLVDCGADFSCPTGSICVVNSCCGEPVCVTPELAAACPPTPSDGLQQRSRLAPRESVPGSVGG